jgi:hypothetical protein
MCADHADYNTTCWNFFDRHRFEHSPAGGEFNYYTDKDQQTVLGPNGSHGNSFEVEAAKFHISYMIGSDQPSYHPLTRIKGAGIACGYKFHISALYSNGDSSLVTVHNKGIAPIYYDAYIAINGVRSTVSLKMLQPGDSLTCSIASGGGAPVLTIECNRLVGGQMIQFSADLPGEISPIKNYRYTVRKNSPTVNMYTLSGQLIYKNLTIISSPGMVPGVYATVQESVNATHLPISNLNFQPIIKSETDR